MIYDRIQAPESVSSMVDCYWIIEDDDKAASTQKILPDGFPELIFHYAEPYQININGTWETQPKALIAGQIKNHFQLRNTGRSGMIGIKLYPSTLTELFGISMHSLSDRVINLFDLSPVKSSDLVAILTSEHRNIEKISRLNNYFEQQLISPDKPSSQIRRAIDTIFQTHGLISINELCSQLSVKERTLERLFSKYIGLSPKFYCRIIRFNYVFRTVQNEKLSWSELAQRTGFYDQSHFNNNFREFVGEEPTKYYFNDNNMANFHLNRQE